MQDIDWEEWSYIATVVAALPVAAGAVYFFFERHMQRQAEEEESRIEREENYSRLQAEFRKAQFWLADHPEVNMHDRSFLNPVLAEKQRIFYSNLVSLLEESFILFHKPDDPEYVRLWNTWEDYMNELLTWDNFRQALPELLKGEDESFVNYVRGKAAQLDSGSENSPESIHL